MSESTSPGARTLVSRIIPAPRSVVYRAFLDADAVAKWLPPESMTGEVLAFEPRVGGRFSMSLTYQDPEHSVAGKTTEDTDTFRGRFVELVPDERIVWAVEFESQDAAFAGEMKVAFTLADADQGTEVAVLCEDIPPGIRPEDNEVGSRSTLQNLAALLESRSTSP